MKLAKILVNNEEGIQYITIAESLRKELDAYRNRYGFPSLAKEYHLAEDVRIEILSSDINPYIHIYTNPIAEGFITHPKSGDFKYEFFNKTDIGELGPIETQEQHYIVDGGGWDKNINPITTIYHIPAIDGDGGSSILTPVKDTASFKETHGEYSYGNIYWSNDNVTLSWKGPPSRHIPLQDHLNIPGLTVLDDIEEKTTGELRYYTAFGTNIYSKGSVLVTAPEYNWSGISNKPKVLGAAIQNNILVLIAGVNKRYNTEEHGFYDSVFISTNNKDWELIGEVASYRHRLPYFFNKSGTSAVNRDRVLHINAIDKQVTLEILSNATDINVQISANFWNLSGQGNSIIFREYNDDTLVELPAISTFEESTISTNTGEVITTDLPLYTEGSIKCPEIDGPDNANVGSSYTLVGSSAFCDTNVVWTFSGGSIGEKTGTIISINGCGSAIITATVGDCVITKEVALPNGTWVLDSHIDYLVDSGGTDTWCEQQGSTKICHVLYLRCYCDPSQSQTLPPANWPASCGPVPEVDTNLLIDPYNLIGENCIAQSAPYGGAYFTYRGVYRVDVVSTSIYKWECP